MPLIRKAGYGLCRDTTQKKLLRLQSGWFNASLLNSAYCARTTANQYPNNGYQFGLMQSACWNWFPQQGTSAWVAGASGYVSLPMYFIGSDTTISVYPNNFWCNECTKVNAYNRFSVPETLTGFTITGVRLWLESPGDTTRYWWGTYPNGTSDRLDIENMVGGGLSVKLSTVLVGPSYADSSASLYIDADTLTNNSRTVKSPEFWNAFSYGGVSRFASGAWSYYDLSSADVAWINSNRTFYMYMSFAVGYLSGWDFASTERATFTRYFRGIRLQFYCEI